MLEGLTQLMVQLFYDLLIIKINHTDSKLKNLFIAEVVTKLERRILH